MTESDDWESRPRSDGPTPDGRSDGPTGSGRPSGAGVPDDASSLFDTPGYGAGPEYGSAPFAGAAASGAPMTVAPTPPSLGDGLRWAWSKFTANAGGLVGAAVVWAVIMVAAGFILSLIIGVIVFAAAGVDGTAQTIDIPVGTQITVNAVLGILFSLLGALAVSCWLNGVITIADGHRVEFSDFFRPRSLGPIVAVSLVIGVISALAEIAFGYGLGLPQWVSLVISAVIALLTVWMVYIAADQRTDTATALASGLNLSTSNLGSTVVVYLMGIVLFFVGAVLFLVGLLVTVPLSSLLLLYYLRSLTGPPIAVEGQQASY